MESFIYILRPTRSDMLAHGPTEQEEGLIEKHFYYLQELIAKGVALLVGRTLNADQSAFGTVIFQAESLDEARRIMEEDPAVVGGVMSAEVFPYKIVMHSL